MRRIAVVLILVGALATLITAQASISGAATSAAGTVSPTGPITVKISNGVFHLAVSGSINDVGTFGGTLKGTVDASGKMTFAQANVSFPPFPTSVILPATVTPVVTGDWHGTIDPEKKTISLSGSMEIKVAADGTPISDCPIGPFTVHTQGSNYKVGTGAASVADPAFQIPVVPPSTPGCGGTEDTLNSALGLPGSGGVDMSLAVTPLLTGSGTPPPSTTTFTTTTQAPTTTAAPAPASTVAVSASANTLPRTGGSSGRLALIGLTVVGAGAALATRWRRYRRS